jgi:hypothetical protein
MPEFGLIAILKGLEIGGGGISKYEGKHRKHNNLLNFQDEHNLNALVFLQTVHILVMASLHLLIHISPVLLNRL